MLILAVDTSTDNLGLALMDGDQLKGEYNLSLKRKHSEQLLPLIKQILGLLEIKPEDLDAVAVSIGPGSFTGLRIGITTVKMLARIFQIPVKGVSTLEIMAAGVESNYVLPTLDARNQRIYYSFYQSELKNNNSLLTEILESADAKMTEIPALLNDFKEEEITVIGEKALELSQILKQNEFNVKKCETEKNIPRAAVLARLGRNYINLGQKDNIYDLKPAYLKRTQAEIDWRHKYLDN